MKNGEAEGPVLSPALSKACPEPRRRVEGIVEGPVTFTPIGYVENACAALGLSSEAYRNHSGDFDAPVMPQTMAAAESRVVVAPLYRNSGGSLSRGWRGWRPVSGCHFNKSGVFHFHLVQSYALLQPMAQQCRIRGETAPAPSGAYSPCTRPIAPTPCGATVPHRGDRG
jgi:hypothetical protein